MDDKERFRIECREYNRHEIFKNYCIKNNVKSFDLGKQGAREVREIYKECFGKDVGYWNCRNFRDDLATLGYQILFKSPIFDKEKTYIIVKYLTQRGKRFTDFIFGPNRIIEIYKKLFGRKIEYATAEDYMSSIFREYPHLIESSFDRDEKIKKIGEYLQSNNILITLDKEGYTRIRKLYLEFFNKQNDQKINNATNEKYIKNFTKLLQKKGYPHTLKEPFAERKNTHKLADTLYDKKIKIKMDMESYRIIQKVFQEIFEYDIPINTAKEYVKLIKLNYPDLIDSSDIIISRMDIIIKIAEKLVNENSLLNLEEDPKKTIQEFYKDITGDTISNETAHSYLKQFFELERWDLFQIVPLFLEKKLDYLTSKLYTELHQYFEYSYESDNTTQRSQKLINLWRDFFGRYLSDEKALKYITELYDAHYHKKPLTQESNNIFLQLLEYIKINKSDLTQDSLNNYWRIIFKATLSKETSRQKLKFLQQQNDYTFSVEFKEELPSINTGFSQILLLESEKGKFKEHWNAFALFTEDNQSLFSTYKKDDFILDTVDTYQGLLDSLNLLDESFSNENRKKNLIVLFCLYLTSCELALLPTSLIFSGDSFIFNASNLKYLEKFRKTHFFKTMPFNKDHIKNELKTNSKAKKIFYFRFSYLINSNIEKVIEISDTDIQIVMNNMEKTKEPKMVSDNENPMRRCLYWHGAHNISQSKAKADKVVLTPLELLAPLGPYKNITKLLDAFYRFFSSKKNNTESRKYAKEAVALLEYLYITHEEINKEFLYKFFHTGMSASDKGKEELSSRFLQYLHLRELSASAKQDFQMIVYQAVENDYDLAGAFPNSFLVTLYAMPRTRNIARLALKKEITDEMKYICLFDPPKDHYYISTSIDKSNMMWQHFDRVEPQLPVMLFLHLCMPWRSEHIKSLDRDNFLQTDAHGNVIGVQVTTDKNQNNNFYIERQFFDYAFNFIDQEGNITDTMSLLQETIEYSKESFPLLQAELRKENPVWGEIKPILCSNKGKGFISGEAYAGYYYKVLLKALFNLGYSSEEIEYYVQLSKEGNKKFGAIPTSFDVIDKLTCNKTNNYFNSEFFSPHSLRKSNITYFVNDKRSFEFILRLSGHQALGTVLQVYIDYNLLKTMGISEEIITAVENNFRTNNTKEYAKDIIENFKKYHFVDFKELLGLIEKHNLFFSIYSLDKSQKSLMKNDTDYSTILEPVFWELLATGICTYALNCPPHIRNRCSLCPHFLTGSKFFSAINSRIMQLTTKVVEYFKIIDKHNLEETLSSNEAVIYEEEAQNDLAELQGYIAIAQKLNDTIYNILLENMPDDEIKNLPVPEDFDVILTKHIPFLAAQLEIYKVSKQNMDINLSTQFSISTLYEKIMELIILDEIPKEQFKESIVLNDKEKAIDTLIGVLDSYGQTDKLETITQQFLPDYSSLKTLE